MLTSFNLASDGTLGDSVLPKPMIEKGNAVIKDAGKGKATLEDINLVEVGSGAKAEAGKLAQKV